MKTSLPIHRGLMAMLLAWCFVTIVSAQTIRNFDTAAGTPYLSARCAGDLNAPLPIELPGGPSETGNFLRLATTFVPTSNTIAFDRTNTGIFSTIVAEFDFRITPGVGRADGIGFALLNTADYNRSGPVCPALPPFIPEEPNFTGSLGVGFDIYQNTDIDDISNNHISIHFDETLLHQVDVTPVIDLAGSQWIHTEIIMRPGNGFSDVSVKLGPFGGNLVTVIDNFPVPGFEPYEGRVLFGARSGGESADHDLDNVNVQFSGSVDPALYGQWSEVIDAQVIPIHLHLLPTGKVLYWENGGHEEVLLDEIRLWDPATGEITTPALPEYDVFCTGHSFLADGKLFVTGGHDRHDLVGRPNASAYDPVADDWIPLPDMNAGRWYPTNTTLANGDVLVVSGTITEGILNTLPQVWQPASGTWRDLTDAQQAEPQGGDLYPRMFLTPDGRVFRVDLTPNGKTWYLSTSGAGAWTEGPLSNFAGIRAYGSAVMYDAGKILSVGGSDPPTNHAEIIDLNLATPVWQSVSPMASPRRHLNAVLLPDGKVLAIGGTRSLGFNEAADAVYVAEMWDSEQGAWATMAGMQAARVYHSTALLLPDGRVFAGGGGRPAPGDDVEHRDFEIYSPPYLFKGTQPAITSAPETVTYGQAFFVETPDAATITNVNWIRLPSVTHAFDQNQRFNRLSFSQASGGLNVTAPADPNLAPPGHYMLFILNGEGVPSVAHIIRIAAPGVNVTFWLNTATVPDTVTPNAIVQVRGGFAPLTWDENTGGQMQHVQGDLWRVTVRFDLSPGTSVPYKFNVRTNPASGDGWESDLSGTPDINRQLIIGTNDITLPAQFFNANNSISGGNPLFTPYVQSDSIDVWFRVNMQFNAENFDPTTEFIGVRGNTPELDWGTTLFLSQELGSDNLVPPQFTYPFEHFYSGRVRFDPATTVPGQVIEYKFVITNAAGEVRAWEDGPNRSFVRPAQDSTLVWQFWESQFAPPQVVAQATCPPRFVQGCTLTVPITIDVSNTSPPELLGAYNATLNWAPALLQYTGFVSGNPPFNNPVVNESNVADGQLQFGQFSTTGAGGVVTIINVQFVVVGGVGGAGTLDLNFSEIFAAATFNNLLPLTEIRDCSFAIEQGCLLGDVTLDNLPTIFDALIIASYSVGLSIPQGFGDQINQGCGDVTLDQATTIFDALVIATFAVGLPVEPFPVGEPLCP